MNLKINPKAVTICSMLLLVCILSSASSVFAAKPFGTTLSASVTTSGFMEHRQTYDWVLTKAIEPSEVELKQGQTSYIDATIVATRQLTSETDVYGVSGAVTVTNSGAVTTENLQVTVVVQYKAGGGPFQDLNGASTTLTVPSQLQAGKTGIYQYSIQYAQVVNAQYRIIAYVKITNHSGHIGTPWGPEPKADYTLPSSPTANVNVDATAQLTDETVCPVGFSYVSNDTGPWHLTDSTTIHYVVGLTNNAANPQEVYSFVNTATLTEETTLQQHIAAASVTVHPSLFQVPEYWLGGLGALFACIAGFAVFAATKSRKRA